MNGNVLESFRRGTVTPYSISSKVPDFFGKRPSATYKERTRIALLNAQQLARAVHPQRIWVDMSLLTPLPGLDRLGLFEDNNRRMRDETANAVKQAAQPCIKIGLFV